jgi:hypothetical protein
VTLADGEAYCSILPGTTGPDVVTGHAEVRHVGTSYSVKVTPTTTTVTVEKGRVSVVNKKGSGEVTAGHQVKVEKGRAPGKARKVNVAEALSWRYELAPKIVTVNFGPKSMDVPEGVFNDSGEEYARARGYGWLGPMKGPPIPGIVWKGQQIRRGRGAVVREKPANDPLRASWIHTGWKNSVETWVMPVPNGQYLVTVCVGDHDHRHGPHRVVVEGVEIIHDVVNELGAFVEREDVPVVVRDGILNMEVGLGTAPYRNVDPDGSTDTTINFIRIKKLK